jgi:shikimate kinase
MENIFLTGFMGTGKSTVGSLLADRTGLRFVDLDAAITTETGMTIPRIFAQYGEEGFRDLEASLLQRVAAKGGMVVALGGGAVIREANRRLIRANGVVINLTASLATLRSRLSGDTGRPLLDADDPEARMIALLAARESCYNDCDARIETSGKSPLEIVEEILAWLKDKAAR